MHYFIDGYNLLFRFSSDESALENSRKEFISDLNNTSNFLNLDITLVFDAAYTNDDLSRSHFDNIELIFTSEGESADDYIVDALEFCKKPQNEMIVTSDKGLSRRCRGLGAHTQSVHEFIKWIRHRDRTGKGKKKQSKELFPSESSQELLVPKRISAKKDKKKESSKIFELLPPINKGAPTTELFEYYLEIFEKKLKEENPSKNNQED
jgi:uncharacterized protein